MIEFESISRLRMTIDVPKVLDHLFDRILEEGAGPAEIKELSDSVGKVAISYPEIWSEVFNSRLSGLKPSLHQSDWVLLISHLSRCRPFPKLTDKQIEPIIEHCVTSIYSVDATVREAGLIGLKAISQSNLHLTLSKVAFSLKIYTINEQVIQLLDLMAQAQDINSESVEKILNIIFLLLSEEDAVKPELLGDLACCIAPCCSYPDLIDPLSRLSDLIIPTCWRKDLVSSNSSSLFGLYKAAAALIAIVPPPPGSGTVHAIQSGVLRLLIHTKTSEELIRALEAVKLLTVSGNFLNDQETCNACIPILIDLGIAVGPLALLGPVDESRTVQRALFDVWHQISSRGFGFILERASHASQLSMVDRIVTLVYLNWAIEGNRFASERIDVLVSCVDHLCSAYTSAPPFLALPVLELVASACRRIPGFLLTVPIIDFVVTLAVKPNASAEPTSIKTYWFSSKDGEVGIADKNVQDRAQTVIVLLAEMAGRDSVFALRERIVECMTKSMPVVGVDALVKSLVRISEPISDRLSGSKLIAWSAVHLSNRVLMEGIAKLTVGPLPWSKSRDSAILESIFEFVFSKKFFEKSPNILRALSFARDLVPLLPNGCAGRTLIQCLQKCDQEIYNEFLRNGYQCIEEFGSVIGSIPFAEFTHLMNEMTAHLHKSRNRLVVLMGLKKDSNEVIFAILRSALGFSAVSSTTRMSELLLVLKDVYLQPCFDTIKEAPQSGLPTVSVRVTLEALVKIVPVVSSVMIQPDGGEFVNSLISCILPLMMLHGCEDSVIVRLSMEAVTALASVPQLTLTTRNFDQAVQFGVSVLVHGITSFSTLEIEPYADRIKAVSNLLLAVLSHSFNPWLGVSRLAQLLHMAGSSSPLPILRVICMQVFYRIFAQKIVSLAFDESKSSIIEWIECCVLVIPRLRDPTTETVAREVLDVLYRARGFTAETSSFTDIKVIPNKYVMPFIQLLLHAAASDAEHLSVVHVIELVNELILTRGPACISQQDSPGLVSIMLGYADKQPLFLDCVHAISSIHLTASLTEIITESVASVDRSFSDSQIGAIQSIAKERNLLVGFVGFMTDLVNNAEPCADGSLAPECIVAATALDIALCVQDSLVPAMVQKCAAPLFGTALLFAAIGGTVKRRNKTRSLAVTVLKRLEIASNDTMSPDELLTAFLSASEETRVTALAEFLIPFMKRNDPRKCIVDQRRWAENFLAHIVGLINDDETVRAIKEAFRQVESVIGLGQILVKRKTYFASPDLELVIKKLETTPQDIATISACVDLLLVAAEMAGRMSGDAEWRTSLITLGPIICQIISDNLIDEDTGVNARLFSKLLALIIGLCDVAALAPDPTPFKDSVSSSLMLQVEIRANLIEDLGLAGMDGQLGEKCLISLRKLCPEKQCNYENDFKSMSDLFDPKTVEFVSMTSPSRSPLVVKGASRVAVHIANKPETSLKDKSIIVRSLLRFIGCKKKSFVFDSAKEYVIAALGDLTQPF
jgi:hypothetical protein